MKKIIKILLPIIIVVAGVFLFFYYRHKQLEEIVIEEQKKWDITLVQNTILSGDYMGVLYEKDYDIHTLPEEYKTPMIVDYYINNTDFFSEENKLEGVTYQKTVSESELLQQASRLFGPDQVSIALSDQYYGCGRSIQKVGSDYIIQAKDSEYCGIFDDTIGHYISYIDQYYKEKDNIIIEMNVAYVEAERIDEDNYTLLLYSDKTKTKVLDSNYSYDCLSGEDKSCFTDFQKYKVMLQKGTDKEYHFYKIWKESTN